MQIEVLGNVQDGGVPHLGCRCDICEKARDDPEKQQYVTALLLKNGKEENSIRYLVDASPDVRFQIVGETVDGVFISHGHLGHINGLLYFGQESIDVNSLPVYCSGKTHEFLEKNDPYRFLIDRENIVVNEMGDREEQELQGGSIQARKVVPRYVNTDTYSWMIEGEEKKLYYMSDIDEWTDEAIENVEEADIAIIDGTFWSKDEIDRYEEVPHPPIKVSMQLFENTDTEIYFTHMNHTNPVLREDSGERQEMEEKGFQIVERGDEFEI